MVFKRQVEGDVTKAEDCKIAVYSCPVDLMQTETKVSVCVCVGWGGWVGVWVCKQLGAVAVCA